MAENNTPQEGQKPEDQKPGDQNPAVSTEDFAALQKMVEDQAKTIASLSTGTTKIEEKAAPKLSIPKKALTVGEKKYKFTVPHFKHNGQYITAEDAAIQPELLAEIAGIEGQGILKEQF